MDEGLDEQSREDSRMNWLLSFLLAGVLAVPGSVQEQKKDHRMEALEKLYPVLKNYSVYQLHMLKPV